MKKIVCIANIDWNFSWQRHQSFMTILANNSYEVCFINNTSFARIKLSDCKRVFNRIFGVKKKCFQIPKNISLYSPIVLPAGIPLSQQINKGFLYPKITETLSRNGFGHPDILYTFLPTELTLQLINTLSPRKVIYDYVGDFFSHPRKPKNLEKVHLNLMEKSDLVLTDSERLYNFLTRHHNNIHILHNGVSEEFFTCKLNITNHIPKNLCYFGTVSDDRLDFQLIKSLLENGYTINLIGPLKGSIPIQHENLIFKGLLNLENLVDEIGRNDVIIFPYLNSEFSASIMPAKIYQCLATGKPIISYGLPLLADFKPDNLIYLASDIHQFLALLIDLPNNESHAKVLNRREIAKQHHEINYAGQLLNLIQSI